MYYAFILSLIISASAIIQASYDVQFHLSNDPIIKQYINTLYDNELAADPVYILAKPATLFFAEQDDESTLYMSTGYVCPRFKIADDTYGTCITYGTYFLLHELYLEYLLEHPETIICEESNRDTARIDADLQARKLNKVPHLIAHYLNAIVGDADVFVERSNNEYCVYQSTIVKNSNEQGTQYIISALLGETLFKRAQKEYINQTLFDDAMYLGRLFNDRSHWTPLTDEQETFFNAHKDEPLNGGFLSDTQTRILFEAFLEKGLFAGLYKSQGINIYIDISGFMVGNHNHALLVCNTNEKNPTFIMSPYLIHLIAKNEAKQFFAELTPSVAEALSAQTL